MEAWEEMMDRELSVFKQGEKYSYVKDMRDAFDQGVSSTTVSKILATIPSHVFWDIKKPQHSEHNFNTNPYNPARQYPYDNFFEQRAYDQYLHDRAHNTKLADNVTRHRQY